MSSFVVCGKCQQVRGGPIGEVEGVEVFQLCGCSTVEEHRAQPNVGDLNAVFELCRCCGLEALRSGSRWSVWFCGPCKERVLAFNKECRSCVVPIGRHSLMNRVTLDTDADLSVSVPAFTSELSSMFKSIDQTSVSAAAAVRRNLTAAGLPPDEDVDLDDYLAAVQPLQSVKAERFAQAVDALPWAPSE